MEAYVDVLIVKSLFRSPTSIFRRMLCHHQEAKYEAKSRQMHVRPDVWKLLGFIISQRKIEASPKKIKAIMDMQAPKTIRDIQHLTESLATLRIFISKIAKRCLPFFDTPIGASTTRTITWNEECQKAFEDLKQ